MPGDPRGAAEPTRWFPDARLNFAENLLDGRGRASTEIAIVFRGESGARRELTWGELRTGAASVAAALRARGVTRAIASRRCCPTCPRPSSRCSPPRRSARSSRRARPTSAPPRYSIASARSSRASSSSATATGTAASGSTRSARLDALLRRLAVGRAGRGGALPEGSAKPPLARDGRDARVAREQLVELLTGAGAGARRPPRPRSRRCPSTIRSTSCTPRAPRAAQVHAPRRRRDAAPAPQGARLHVDLRPGDRLFYFTTCGWMMWNWLVSGLAVGATVVLYDGSPLQPRRDDLCDLAERKG